MYTAPLLGRLHWNFVEIFGIRKLDSLTFSRFDRSLACDRQTDRETDRISDTGHCI